MKIIIVLFFIIPGYFFSQVKYSLDNTITGLYGTTKTGNQLTINLSGTNSIDYKKFGFDYNPTYSIQYSPELTNNEYLSRQNFRYTNSKYDAFLTHTYNYSYIRGINSDNFIGIGGGIKKEAKDKFKFSLSYAVLYQFTNYKTGEDSKYIRHSLRTRIKLNSKKFQILSEFYFQPTFNNLIDHIISGNNQIILFPKNKISFTIQDLINYRRDSNIPMIHRLTIGLKIKLNN